MPLLTQMPAWQALASHRDALSRISIRALFARDPERAAKFSHEAAGLFVDYSKNLIDEHTIASLIALAREAGVEIGRAHV